MSCYLDWHAKQLGVSDPEELARCLSLDPNRLTSQDLAALPRELLHLALDALEAQTVPESYYNKVMESRRQRGWSR